jgi:hypothetical protein
MGACFVCVKQNVFDCCVFFGRVVVVDSGGEGQGREGAGRRRQGTEISGDMGGEEGESNIPEPKPKPKPNPARWVGVEE